MTHELKIQQRELADAVKRARRLGKAWRNAKALLTFDGTSLAIEIAGLRVGVPATGSWNGTARLTKPDLSMLAELRSKTEAVVLRMEPAGISVHSATGDFNVPCVWQKPEPRISVPLGGLSLLQLLHLVSTHSREDLENSGLDAEVSDALRKRDSLIERASDVLAPVGITRDDVRALVEAKTKEMGSP